MKVTVCGLKDTKTSVSSIMHKTSCLRKCCCVCVYIYICMYRRTSWDTEIYSIDIKLLTFFILKKRKSPLIVLLFFFFFSFQHVCSLAYTTSFVKWTKNWFVGKGRSFLLLGLSSQSWPIFLFSFLFSPLFYFRNPNFIYTHHIYDEVFINQNQIKKIW